MMSDKRFLHRVESSFFFRRVVFEDGKLIVTFGDDDSIHGAVTFDYVRTFLLFKESDFFVELAKYEHEKLISGKEDVVGVYRIKKRSILSDVLHGRLDQESPGYFWVSSPDECLEVVAFSEPCLQPNYP